jgi:hypothetical protein
MVSAISLGFHRIVDRLSREPWSANMAVIIGHAAVFHDRSRDSPLELVVLSLPRGARKLQIDLKREEIFECPGARRRCEAKMMNQ